MTASISLTMPRTTEDLDDVGRLARSHIEYERSDAVPPADWGERAARLIAEGRLAVYLARVGGDAVGYASVTVEVATWTTHTFAHLDCLYIASGFRGLGIGGILFHTAVQDARSQGHRELQWQTPAWNEGAIRFYERLGARHSPKQRFSLRLVEQA